MSSQTIQTSPVPTDPLQVFFSTVYKIYFYGLGLNDLNSAISPTPSFNNTLAIISNAYNINNIQKTIISIVTSIQKSYVLLIYNLTNKLPIQSYNVLSTMLNQFDDLRIIIQPLYTDNSYNSVNTTVTGNLQTLLSQAKNNAIEGFNQARNVYISQTSKNPQPNDRKEVDNKVVDYTRFINSSDFSKVSSTKLVSLNAKDLLISTIPTTPTKTAAAPLGYYVQLARSIYMAIYSSPRSLAGITSSNPTPTVINLANTVLNARRNNTVTSEYPAFTSAAGTVPVNPTLVFKSDGSGMLA